MEFPRLTSGGSGRLTFDVVNDMFERIEALEGKGIAPKKHRDYMSDIFPAKISQENPAAPGQYFFQEQQRLANGSYEATSGRSSSGYLNGALSSYAYPAIAPTGLPNGTFVFLHGRENALSKLEYLAISQIASTTVAIIQSSSAIVTNARWKYTVAEAEYVAASDLFRAITGAQPFFAWNGAENVADTGTTYGVGFIPQTPSPVLTRQPIRAGVTVEIIRDKNGLSMFSIPNGYRVVC